jgi:ABC-type sugar transport system ATPase subunit
VRAVADRIVVLRLGKNAGTFAIGEVTHEDIVAAITGARDNVVTRRQARTEGHA